jgi:hypothetical protein
MHISDKLMLLLNVNPTGVKLGVSQDELCIQLGRNWDDIREDVGILRSFGWVNCANRCDIYGKKTKEIEYWLTAVGCKELDRRKRVANPILKTSTHAHTSEQLTDRLHGKGTKK